MIITLEQYAYNSSFHLTSPEPGFMNDMQTFVYDENQRLWHGYYLWNGDYSWGGNGSSWRHYATSNWENFTDHGVAIPKYQTKEGDVASGSIVIDNANLAGYGAGAWLAYVTSYCCGLQTTNLWYSTDNGHTFSPCESNPVQPNTLNKINYRDPFAFIHDNHVYLYLAEESELGVYRSATGKAPFDYLGSVPIEYMGMIECPAITTLYCPDLKMDKAVLVFGGNGGGLDTTGTFLHVGTLDDNMLFHAIETPTPLAIDLGADFYGAHIGYQAEGAYDNLRCLAWVSNWGYWQCTEALPAVDCHGNIGCASVPRKVTLRYLDNRYRLETEPDFDFPAGTLLTTKTATSAGSYALDSFSNGRGRLRITLEDNNAENLTLAIGNDKWRISLALDSATGVCTVTRWSVLLENNAAFLKPHRITLPAAPTRWDVLIDRQVVEIFFDTGTSATFTTFSDGEAVNVAFDVA